MSTSKLVNQLITLLNLFCFINCNYTSIQDIIKDIEHQKSLNNEANQTINRRSGDKVILDGVQYFPECGLLCRFHKMNMKFISHLPPVMINFNHQYQNFIPIPEPIPVLAHNELDHHEIFHPDLHQELHSHTEMHQPNLVHHKDLHSNLHLGLHPLHSKLLPDHHQLPAHHFGLPNIHQHLGLSSNFHQTITENPNRAPQTAPLPHHLPAQHLHTSASTLSGDHNLDAIQRMFAHHESKYPVTIVEENFALPDNYNSIRPGIDTLGTHPSSIRPLFVPEKQGYKSQAVPPYELEDSRSTFIDYQPFHFPSPHRPAHFDHHNRFPFYHNNPQQNQNPYFNDHRINNMQPPIYDQPFKKPNIEIIRLNEQDHDYPPRNNYDKLMAEVHSKIKDPTTYYQHPEPQKGSIVYADSEMEHKKPSTGSKIDENSVINIGQNYGRVKHIQEQYNSLKRQYPGDMDLHSGEMPVGDYEHHPNKYDNYHNLEQSNYQMPNLGQHHIETHHFNPHEHHHMNPHEHHHMNLHEHNHMNAPVIIEESPPMHINHQYEQMNYHNPPLVNYHHQQAPVHFPLPPPPVPAEKPKTMKSRPGMEFNGFYSNFYNNLPPAPRPSYSPYKK